MVKEKGINMGGIKVQNRASLIRLLKYNGAMSRKDLAAMLGLTPAAVTLITNKMQQEGLIKEVGECPDNSKKVGRKKILIDINYQYRYVLGVSISPDFINCSLADLKGTILENKKFKTDRTLTPEKCLKKVASECMNLLYRSNVTKKNTIGVGLSVVGLVNAEKGISKHAFDLWKEEVPIKSILQKELNLKVVVDNRVRMLAMGELKGSETPEEEMLIVNYGPGIGSALYINKELFYGSHNMSGDIGHTLVTLDGELCHKCGQRGCLDTIVNIKRLIKRVEEIYSEEKTPLLYKLTKGNLEKITYEKISQAADKGEQLLIDQLIENGEYMAFAVFNAVKLFDPKRVVLYGRGFLSKILAQSFIKKIDELSGTKKLQSVFEHRIFERNQASAEIAMAIKKLFDDKGGI